MYGSSHASATRRHAAGRARPGSVADRGGRDGARRTRAACHEWVDRGEAERAHRRESRVARRGGGGVRVTGGNQAEERVGGASGRGGRSPLHGRRRLDGRLHRLPAPTWGGDG